MAMLEDEHEHKGQTEKWSTDRGNESNERQRTTDGRDRWSSRREAMAGTKNRSWADGKMGAYGRIAVAHQPTRRRRLERSSRKGDWRQKCFPTPWTPPPRSQGEGSSVFSAPKEHSSLSLPSWPISCSPGRSRGVRRAGRRQQVPMLYCTFPSLYSPLLRCLIRQSVRAVVGREEGLLPITVDFPSLPTWFLLVKRRCHIALYQTNNG